ncbi:MAG TPA: insulinase family protein [Bacteroidetes bacterium]|nr:insulinase family protein [Bacteroidota bacterium]
MEKKTIDRTLPPQAAPMEKIPFPQIHQVQLSNGVPVYLIPFGAQKVVEINIVFPAGRSFEPSPAVASFTGKMIQEGTLNYTSLEFAQKLDHYGAFIGVETGFERSSASLTSLEKHLESTIPLLQEMLVHPKFPEKDLDRLLKRTIQHLDVEEQKTEYTARKEFNQLLFGQDHPYGRTAGKQEVQDLSNDSLKAFFAHNYNFVNATILVCGCFDQAALLDLLESHFGDKALIDEAQKVDINTSGALREPASPSSGLHYFEKEDSVQATVRVGLRGFTRNHPDYHKMLVVNTILGGYFGSRLMKNIREEKGYTYGIGSAWLSMRHQGFFIIQTDIGNEYIRPTLTEMDKEIRKLIEDGVSEDELQLVKNYMLGRMASGRETPAQIIGLVNTLLASGIPFENLNEKFDIIQSVTTEDVQSLATQYLNPDKLLQVVSGKMEE